MYNLSVLAMFKNESWIIKEWIEHYLLEGVEHFYLIDNGSTDNYEDIIKIYNDKYDLIKDETRLPKGTQTHLYTKHYLKKIKKETKWIIICDIDEYIYARNGFQTIPEVLEQLPDYIDNIWLPWKIFGSNGNIKQPNNIVEKFTKRTIETGSFLGHGKCIVKTKKLIGFGCCGHYIELENETRIYTSNRDNYYLFTFTEESCSKFNLHLNHYMMMSEEYYEKIKCNRGGGESGFTNKYSLDYFRETDSKYNMIEDNELYNKKMKINILKQKYIPTNIEKNIMENYLSKSIIYLEIGTGKTTYYMKSNKNIKTIISIEEKIDKYNEINDLMIDKNNFILIYLFDKYIKINDIIDIKTIENIDTIYINDNKCLYCLYLYEYINKNCIIIFENFNKKEINKLLLDYYNIIKKYGNDTVILQKKKELIKINKKILNYLGVNNKKNI